MALIEYPSNEMSDLEKWAYLKELEGKLKLELKVVGEKVKQEFGYEGGVKQTKFGNVQQVMRVTQKPKDDLKFYLAEMDVLEVCKKDDIDLTKVKDLIESGYLDNEEVEKRLETTETSYLKFKQNREEK